MRPEIPACQLVAGKEGRDAVVMIQVSVSVPVPVSAADLSSQVGEY